MYKYQCSRKECESTWTLPEGNLNGFLLVCPICVKGRGLFVSQTKREMKRFKGDIIEEMIIEVPSITGNSINDVNAKIEEMTKKHPITIVEKSLEITSKDIVCIIKYKLKG